MTQTDPGERYDVFAVSLDAGLPEVDRIDMWRDHVGRNQGAAETRIENTKDFVGWTWTQVALTSGNGDSDPNRIQLVEFGSSAIDYTRSGKIARADGDESARLFIPVEGTIDLAQSDYSATIKPGGMGVVRWNLETHLSHKDDLRAYIVNLPPYALPSSHDPQGPLGIQPKNFVLKNVRMLVENLTAHRHLVSAEEFIAVGHVIIDLIAGTLDERRAPELDGYARVVADARRRIRLYYSDSNLTVGTVAEQLGVSPRYLQRAVNKLGQRSLGEELRTIRLERARDLLLASSETIPDIVDVATACGYSSLSGFRDAFAAKYGIQAGEFAVQARSSDQQPPCHGSQSTSVILANPAYSGGVDGHRGASPALSSEAKHLD